MSEPTNFDELKRLMDEDELHDASKLSPREYGKLRGINPQLIYYHIRTHSDPTKDKHLLVERCLCGKKVIDVKLADQYFGRGEFDPSYNDARGEER